MTQTAIERPGSEPPITRLVRSSVAAMEAIPYWLVALVARLSIAGVFWRSGQTKVQGWALSDVAVELFKTEYKLPLVDPTVAAYAAAFAEHIFPIMLVLGLATRFSALALFLMTLVIQIFVYPDAWPTHGTWAIGMLLLMMRGAGAISLDRFIPKPFGERV